MKKTISLFIIGAATVLTPLNSPNAMAQTAEQVRRLREVGVPVVMPQYLPNGFRLANFEATLGGRYNNNYHAIYQGPNSCEFTMGGADGGWGDAGDTVRTWVINSKLFGRILLEAESYYGSSNPTTLVASILEGELNRKPLKNYPNAGYIASFNCRNRLFSPQEANKIIHSFRLR